MWAFRPRIPGTGSGRQGKRGRFDPHFRVVDESRSEGDGNGVEHRRGGVVLDEQFDTDSGGETLRVPVAGVIPLGIIPVMAMTLRLTEEQTAKLRATAEREGVSMQAVALKAIDEYVDRRMQRRDEIIEQIFTEDAELFRRLADS